MIEKRREKYTDIFPFAFQSYEPPGSILLAIAKPPIQEVI